ncbi:MULTISPECIES: nicotinate (nicotinamide) nucleotide adenylyltransferase [Gammaproteobacteria]|uniref:nicotinate (nicotinamide) nucleotide adenylyltransferase n=1 Tax=Gammaproteobacteria TaxID=1236 RepID=UPI000DD0C379|nr:MULTISPECIES: nicotinate (nicotinamide) nucleotide adenylyltransferase [Gammaproteobacteria]RTE87453.1 nicotinate (nicotinamide) nucleotide adenylyltransferase [Aliidiomarina sp. B3213]TCZ92762.1 nicotinate (nicotinamide) nucleotide adenylyltransferase [Lysobacter sp. N42]
MRVAILGGTFDPIHAGHLDPVLEVQHEFGWNQIHLLPTFTPPYRDQPIATDQQRWEMVQLAAETANYLVANDYELSSKRPSRTLPTLKHFKQQHSTDQLYFLIGMDSFVSLDKWLSWRELTDYARLVVFGRPKYDLSQCSSELNAWAAEQKEQGKLFFPQTNTVNISSTELRELIQTKGIDNVPDGLLSPEVANYIKTHNLYR